MFSRISTAFFFALVAFAVFAAALPKAGTNNPPVTTTVTVTAPAHTATEPASQCNTGDIQCCNSTGLASDSVVGTILALLGIQLTSLDVLVGLSCSPLTILGGGGSSCTQQPVCCTNNNFNGVVAIGCTPINVNLR